MKVYDIINTVKQMRPGSNFDTALMEKWISECDASIQIEVCRKNPKEIRLIRARDWETGKTYPVGEMVSYRESGEWHQYISKKEFESNIAPNADPDNWTEIAYDTYVSHPHDRLYVYYVIAMMDYANMEYDNYANDRAMYEAALDEFAKWWQREYSYTWKKGVDQYEIDVRHSQRI